MENGNPYWLSVIHFPKQCLKKPKPRIPVAPGCAPPAGALPTIVNAICLPMTLPCVDFLASGLFDAQREA